MGPRWESDTHYAVIQYLVDGAPQAKVPITCQEFYSTNQPIMLHFLMYIVKKVKLGDSKRVL
ncbi:MAG: hypothetical protein JRF37_09945 [Deltaproteobacteria bacterium]|nr:hypothetical protein [Deltaproteobacteria bacterium]